MGQGTIVTVESKVQTRKGSKPVTSTQPVGSTPGKYIHEDIEEYAEEEDNLSDSDSEVEFRHQNPEFVEHSDHEGNQPVADQEYDGGTASKVSDHSNDSQASDEIPQSPPPVVARPVARRRNLSPHQPVRRSSRICHRQNQSGLKGLNFFKC